MAASGALGSILGGFGGGVIGGAVVQLGLDDSRYKTGLAQTEASVKTSTSRMGGALTALKGVGVLAFAALAAGAVKFAGDAVKAAQEHEVVVQRLTRAVGESSVALQGQASALQMVTGFSDEAIISAQTVLSRFELTGDQLQRVTPLVLDYARATGQEVPAAAQSIGKALLGNTRALKAVGIEYEVTGNRTKDAAVLMDLLRDKLGGVSAAFGETSAGKAAILNEQFEEFKETIGTGLLPILDQFKETLISLGPALGFLGKMVTFGLQAIEFTINSVIDAVGSLLQVIDTIAGPLYSFDGSTTHAAESLARFTGEAHEATRALDTVSVSYDNSSRAAKDSAQEFLRSAGTMEEWRNAVVENIRGTFGTISSFENRWTITAKEFRRNANLMARQAEQFTDDLKTLDKLDLTRGITKALLNEGPAAVHAFVDANKKGRDDIVAALKSSQGEYETQIGIINRMTSSVKNTNSAVDKLDGKKAKAEVEIDYSVTGVSPQSLPGLEGGRAP